MLCCTVLYSVVQCCVVPCSDVNVTLLFGGAGTVEGKLPPAMNREYWEFDAGCLRCGASVHYRKGPLTPRGYGCSFIRERG